MRIHDLISEIKELKSTTPRKMAFDIYNLLENNSALFLQHMDAENFKLLHNNFELLAKAAARDFGTDNYRDEVLKNFNLLLFYFDRIL